MLSPNDKARIALSVMGLFAFAYGVNAVRTGVFVMAMRNVARTVEIRRSDAPVRFWIYVSLFVGVGVVLLGRAWYGSTAIWP
jgi:phosphate/sulfate permease